MLVFFYSFWKHYTFFFLLVSETSERVSEHTPYFFQPNSIDWESNLVFSSQKDRKNNRRNRERKKRESNEKTLKTSCELIENTWKSIHKSRIVTNSFASISNANFIQSQCFDESALGFFTVFFFFAPYYSWYIQSSVCTRHGRKRKIRHLMDEKSRYM